MYCVVLVMCQKNQYEISFIFSCNNHTHAHKFHAEYREKILQLEE